MLNLTERRRRRQEAKRSTRVHLRRAVNIAPPNVAAHVRRARRQQGLSLETLAELSGVSRAMLGQIETGKSVPTITVIWKIAAALAVPVASLIASDAQHSLCVLRAHELRVISSSDSMFLQRRYTATNLTQPFDFSHITIEPGHREVFPALPNGGPATLVVATGTLCAVVGDDGPALLNAGDAILFRSDVAHSLSNQSANPATAYLVSLPRLS